MLPAGKVPIASSLARVSSLWMIRATSSDMRLTISRDVPAGASLDHCSERARNNYLFASDPLPGHVWHKR